ncbi:MAG: plastocyanin/azurin family copper-binding protein [Chloroflexota bacterium]
MNRRPLSVLARAACATIAALAVVACASGTGPGWTYAPLGPTPSAGASSAPTPGGSPAGTLIEVATNNDNPLAFVPATLNATPNTLVTVQYNNNSSLEHNINFFNGPDQNAPSLGATEKITGPNQLRSVTFTTPANPGDYFFWCDVHATTMVGTLHIAQ